MKVAGCDSKGEYYGKEQKDYEKYKAQKPSESKKRILKSMGEVKKTVGWTDCNCDVGFDAGVVLDPFLGRGTTMKVARDLGRNSIGIELQADYLPIIKKYLEIDQQRFGVTYEIVEK